MRTYIPKKVLDITLHNLVEMRQPDLLEVCLELSRYYRDSRGHPDLFIELMLNMPSRLFLVLFDSIITIIAYILMIQFIQARDVLAWMPFVVILFLWTVYMFYECSVVWKYRKQALRYVLVDELIARDMLHIGLLG